MCHQLYVSSTPTLLFVVLHQLNHQLSQSYVSSVICVIGRIIHESQVEKSVESIGLVDHLCEWVSISECVESVSCKSTELVVAAATLKACQYTEKLAVKRSAIHHTIHQSQTNISYRCTVPPSHTLMHPPALMHPPSRTHTHPRAPSLAHPHPLSRTLTHPNELYTNPVLRHHYSRDNQIICRLQPRQLFLSQKLSSDGIK